MSVEQTKRRRQAVAAIHDIVSALRAIAAGRIQGAQRALKSARRYQDVVEQALAWVLAQPEAAKLARNHQHTTLLVMTSEQPLCGPFNQNVLALAEKRYQELRQAGDVHLLVVGRRGLQQLAARGITAADGQPAATSLAGLQDLVKRLAVLLGRRYASGEMRTLRVIYSRYQSISEQTPAEEQVLPLDVRVLQPTGVRARRFHRYLTNPELLAGLISQYAFITLYRLAVDSYASEQGSRLVAMDSATRNSERILQQLVDREKRERQTEITQQVLELVGTRFAGE